MCTSAEVLAKASNAFVHAPVRCSQAFAQSKTRPAFPMRDDAAASTASHLNVRDDRDTPLVSEKSARMSERAVLANRPSLELSPLRPKGGRAW